MKKLITILFTSLFFMSSAYAEGMIGVKGGFGSLEGTRTSNTELSGAKSASVDSEYGAVFAEVNLGDGPISAGIELVPMEGVIDTTATTGTDSQVTVENLLTLYLVASKETEFGAVYGKLGYSSADLSAKSNYGHTLSDMSDKAEGPMIGVGLQLDSPLPIFNVVRLEGTYTQFDDLKITSKDADGVNTEKRTGEAELGTISISLARSF